MPQRTDLVVSGRAGVEDFILYFLVPEAVEVALLKQVLPSIHTPQALRGLPIQPMRTTTLLALIKLPIRSFLLDTLSEGQHLLLHPLQRPHFRQLVPSLSEA
jgi:hypothetical protein